MSQNPSAPAVGVPRWLMLFLSVVILFHLSAIVVRALDARSGPWPTEMGADMATPPQFANSLDSGLAWYLKAVGMTSTHHVPSDRVTLPGIYLEARLMNESGEEIARVKIPEDSANPWLRHRQQLIARTLGDDHPVFVPRSKVIPPPGQQVPEVEYWHVKPENPTEWRLTRQSINDFILTERYFRPSDVSLLLVRSYARQLCRQHGAAKVEIIRHHQNPIPPSVIGVDELQPGIFEEFSSTFGEFTREGKSIR